MHPHLVLAMIAALASLAGAAPAGEGSFAVSVEVVGRRPAPALLDAIPVPPRARTFAASDSSRSYAYPGTPESAAAFFESEMARRGWRALDRQGGDGVVRQVWADDRARVRLQLQRALGGTPLTRIRVDVSDHPAAVAPGVVTVDAGQR